MAADEVTYAMEIETKLGKYLIEGTVKTFAELIKLIMWICDERIEEGHVWKGERSIRSITLMSKPQGPMVETLDMKEVGQDVKPEEIYEALKKAGVRYCQMPHSDAYKKFAVAIPPSDAAMAKTVMEMYKSNKSVEKDNHGDQTQKEVDELEVKLIELIKKFEQTTDLETRKDLQEKIDELKITIENKKQSIAEDRKSAEALRNCVCETMTLDEWLKEVAESDTKDLAGVLAAFNEGIEDPWSIKPAEEMCQSLRSEYSIETEPGSSYNYYVAENGGKIRREYHNLTDKEPGNVYSTFEVLTTDGQIVTFTDKDKTSEQWAEEIPRMLAYAGIVPGERMMSFISDKEATRYCCDRERIIKLERTRVNSYVKGMVERGLGFKQPGTATQIRDMLSEERKRREFEYNDPEKYTQIIIPKKSIVWTSKKEHSFIMEAESGGKKYAIKVDLEGAPATYAEGDFVSIRLPNKAKDGKNMESTATELDTGREFSLSMKDLQIVTTQMYKNAQAEAEKKVLGNNPILSGGPKL